MPGIALQQHLRFDSQQTVGVEPPSSGLAEAPKWHRA